MSCWIRQLPEKEKRLKYLLCSLKSFTPSEQKLFTLAALSDPYSGKGNPAGGDNDISSDCDHEIKSTPSALCTKCEQHHKPGASQENHETRSACCCNNSLLHTNTATHTKTDEDKSDYTIAVTTTDERTSAAVVDTSSVMCCTPTRTTDTSVCTTNPSLFTPLPNVPSQLFQQTYTKWKAMMDIHLRLWQLRRHKTIYIQPLDDFPEFVYSSIGNDTDTVSGSKIGGFFELLREYLKVFFSGLDVVLQPAIDTTGWAVTSRHHHMTGKKQLLVGDVHKGLKKMLPIDGCCIVGVTWTDLYPCDDLNFVLGEASAAHKCAAFCFGRYEPKCYVDGKEPTQMKEIDAFIIWKMLKVISHETCHIFNLDHCVHFECLMNESSSMTQMLEQPNFLCPVCLCKLKKVTQCDVVHRYQQLLQFYKDVHKLFPSQFMHGAIAWLNDVIRFLQ